MLIDAVSKAVLTRALLSVALHAVSCASRLSRGVRQEFAAQGGVLTKQDTSPVTVADFGVQALVTMYLREHAPLDTGGAAGTDFRLVAEEDADALAHDPALLRTVTGLVNKYYPSGKPSGEKKPPRWQEADVLDALSRGGDCGGAGSFWFLDPIDGTRGFVRGGHYAIGLGRVDDGVPTLAAVACPTLPPISGSLGEEGVVEEAPGPGGADHGYVFGATCDAPALMMPLADTDEMQAWDRPLETEWEGHMALVAPEVAAGGGRASLLVAESFAGRLCAAQFRCFGAAEGASSPAAFLRLDSMAKYCLVARGDADAYVRAPFDGEKRERIWDHAGALVVTAAGGRVSDFLGRPLDFSRGRGLEANLGVLATSGVAPQGLHDEMLACAPEAWPPLAEQAVSAGLQ